MYLAHHILSFLFLERKLSDRRKDSQWYTFGDKPKKYRWVRAYRCERYVLEQHFQGKLFTFALLHFRKCVKRDYKYPLKDIEILLMIKII